jgi:hypothetical protein
LRSIVDKATILFDPELYGVCTCTICLVLKERFMLFTLAEYYFSGGQDSLSPG